MSVCPAVDRALAAIRDRRSRHAADGRALVAAARALAAIREHPRHLVLAALVVGLLLGRASAAAIVLAGAAFAAAARRPRVAPLAAVAVLAGASFADARLSALDAGVLASLHGRTIATRAVVLEPVRDRAAGPSVARVRLLDGPGAGEQAVTPLEPGVATVAAWATSCAVRRGRGRAARLRRRLPTQAQRPRGDRRHADRVHG